LPDLVEDLLGQMPDGHFNRIDQVVDVAERAGLLPSP
jgi:hypothetical protein